MNEIAKLATAMSLRQSELDLPPTCWLTEDEIQQWLTKSLAAEELVLVVNNTSI